MRVGQIECAHCVNLLWIAVCPLIVSRHPNFKATDFAARAFSANLYVRHHRDEFPAISFDVEFAIDATFCFRQFHVGVKKVVVKKLDVSAIVDRIIAHQCSLHSNMVVRTCGRQMA